MAVLAMDTATQALVVAIGRQGHALTTSTSMIPRGHSRLLQPMTQQLLTNTNLAPEDLDGIAVGIGPGSYTGVRLAIATAKAMATALGIPVTPVPTLAALAESAVSGEVRQIIYVMPLLYARRERAFGSIYAKTGVQWTCVVETQVIEVTAWMDKLHTLVASSDDAPSIIVHDFAGRSDEASHAALQTAGSTSNAIVTLETIAAGVGPAILRIAERQDFGCTPQNGEDVHALVPDYALRVEAEVKQSEGRTADGTGGSVQY
jgi:tRNA threonylcarbamoyladenosine biosynthesis protein TsaB